MNKEKTTSVNPGRGNPGQNTSKNRNQSKGEIKFKIRLLLTNCSAGPSLFPAPAAAKPAAPHLTSQVQISPPCPGDYPLIQS